MNSSLFNKTVQLCPFKIRTVKESDGFKLYCAESFPKQIAKIVISGGPRDVRCLSLGLVLWISSYTPADSRVALWNESPKCL
jgi:hypothetical protein